MAELQKVNLGFPHRRTHSFQHTLQHATFWIAEAILPILLFPNGM
jgi:hypothetical protein